MLELMVQKAPGWMMGLALVLFFGGIGVMCSGIFEGERDPIIQSCDDAISGASAEDMAKCIRAAREAVECGVEGEGF